MKKKLLNLVLIIILIDFVGLSRIANAQTISAGAAHSFFICSDSTVSSWGYNTYGQLGDGTLSSTFANPPVQVSSLIGITAVAGGGGHSLFLKNDGTVWACGRNNYGQFGDGTTTNDSIAFQIIGLSDITAIAAGDFHSLFLKNDGTVWACGRNTSGELGDGTTIQRTTPVQVNSVNGIVALAGGTSHSLFLKNDGTVWACGYNNYGQLGDGTTTETHTPVQANSLSGITSVKAGNRFSVFLKNDGTVWASGDNTYGQLGNGTNTNTFANPPTQANSLIGITAIAVGYAHSLFLKNDGTVWSCGYNSAGQLGDGTPYNRPTPDVVSSLSGITFIAAGGAAADHSLFLKNNGTVWACGQNGFGQLGDGTTTNDFTIVQTIGLCNFLSVEENSVLNNMSIYPNPSNGIFNLNVELQSNIKLQIGIYNLTGQLVKSINSSEFIEGINVKNIDASELSNGTYFVKVYNENLNKPLKFIINK